MVFEPLIGRADRSRRGEVSDVMRWTQKTKLLVMLFSMFITSAGYQNCTPFQTTAPSSLSQASGLPGTAATQPQSTLPTLPSWTTGALSAAGTATEVTVFPASQALQVAPPQANINIATNFKASSPLGESDVLNLYLVDASNNTVATAQNNLNNGLTILPTTSWQGPMSIVTTMTVPNVADGTYYLMLGLNNATGPVKMTAGQGVVQDNQFRYYIGAVRVQSSAAVPTPLAPATLDLTGYKMTFDEEFSTLSISDSTINDGSRWYTHNEQCCMSTSNGAGTAMVGLSSPENPYSLASGGGLDIRLKEVSNNWTSGVITSVDNSGVGFSQQYGYFEMKAKFPSGLDTWPAFWLLNTAAKSGSAPAGEIDIVEYIANPGFSNYFATTLHDWSNGSTPAMSHNMVTVPSDGAFHTYGMLWTASTMTFYYDGTVTFQTPTPAIMHQPYYLILDLGIGAGWPTDTTPTVNDMIVQYVHVYSPN